MSDQLIQVLKVAAYVVCGVAVVCNLLVLTVFAVTKQLRIKYYGFIVGLVIADIVFATVIIVHIHRFSRLGSALFRTSFFVAQLNVLAVAVNRLMALCILPPARFDAIVTSGRIVVISALFWVLSAAIYVPTTYIIRTPSVTLFVRPLIALIVLVITAMVYWLVFRKIAQYRPPLASTPGVSTGDNDQTGARIRQTRYLMMTFTMILVTSFVCWTPHCIGNFIIFFSSSQSYIGQSQTFKVFFRITLNIMAINSVVNPIIYWWRMSDFREGLRGLLCMRWCKETANTEDGSVNASTNVESAM